jgi:hypothetical protein
MELKTASNRKIKHTAFELQIDSESGKISLNEWENELKLSAPFAISEINVFIDAVDGEKVGTSLNVSQKNPLASFDDIAFTLRTTPAGSAYGLDISATEEHSVKIKFTATIKLAQKNVRPVFLYEKEGK